MDHVFYIWNITILPIDFITYFFVFCTYACYVLWFLYIMFIQHIKCILSVYIILYCILSVYSPFSDRVGLPLHNTQGVSMKSMEQRFSTGCPSWRQPHAWDAILNCSKYNILVGNQLIRLYKFVCTIPIQNRNINLCCTTAL